MLNIGFRRYSLLYGESLLLAFLAILIPFFLWPDAWTTRTKHYLAMGHLRRRALATLVYVYSIKWIRACVLGFIITCQLTYALLSVTLGTLVQHDFLTFVNKTDENELSYKVIFYAPILCRMGLFLMVMIGLANRHDYREWLIFDSFEIFSIDRHTQLRIACTCLAIIGPDALCYWVDMMFLFNSLNMRLNRSSLMLYQGADFSTTPQTNLFLVGLAGTVNACNLILRYKPFLTVLYATLCLGLHLRLVRHQVLIYHMRERHRHGRDSRQRHIGVRTLLLEAQELKLAGASELAGQGHLAQLSRAHDDKLALELGATGATSSPTLTGDGLCPVAPPTGPLVSASDSSELTRVQLLPVGSIKSRCLREMLEYQARLQQAPDPLYEIRNLFELERHLTQIYLFVSALDRCSPAAVFSIILFNCVSFFSALLSILAMPTNKLNLYLASLYLGARIAPLLCLFVAGHRLERECKRLVALLELMYFREAGGARSPQSLLYKQMKDSQYSLMRILKLLHNTRLDGNGLMRLNCESLGRIGVYIAGAIFIVIQYDSLLMLDHDTGAVEHSLSASGGLAAPNKSQAV